MALLTGRNHHVNNAGAIMELATGFPGNTGVRPSTVTPLAEILRQNGYSTAAFGKYHETAPWEVSVSGPYDRWPTRSGFDKFYGFIGGETNQWAPAIFDGTVRVEPPHRADYHFTTDMTDQAINWVSAQQALTPDKPFYMYFATGATHAPHHAPKEWIAKYKGQFSGGWDKLREETFARQKKMGVIPAEAKLTPRPKEIPAWDDMSAEQKRLFERQMETFAGFAAHTDHEVGRLVEQLRTIGELDNTLFYYIVGDNGSSAEGGPEGTYNEMMALNGIVGNAEPDDGPSRGVGRPHHVPALRDRLGLGGQHALPVDEAGREPLRRHAQRHGDALAGRHQGQGRDPQPVPSRDRRGAHRAGGGQAAGAQGGERRRAAADGRRLDALQRGRREGRRPPHHAVLRDVRQPRHLPQGWVAATRHSIPWLMVPLPPVKDDVWELYNVAQDFSEANDLAAAEPGQAQGAAGPVHEGGRCATTCCRSTIAGPSASTRRSPAGPDLLDGRKSLTVYPGMTGMMENAFINVKGVHHTVTAEVEVQDANANGVIIAQAGYFGGWTLYAKAGKLHHEYNWFALERTNIASAAALKPGKHTIVYEFVPDEAKPGTGGKSTLSVDGQKVAEGHIPKTQPFMFSADEGTDVGLDGETNVSADYKQGDNAFTGKIVKVTVEQK